MSERVTGIAVQTFIWIIFIFLLVIGISINILNIILYILLAFSLYFYFNVFLFNSRTFKILSEKRKIVKNKQEILNRLIRSKPYVEIYSKAFHSDNYNKEILSKEKYYLYEFEDVEDQTNTIDLEAKLYDEAVNKKSSLLYNSPGKVVAVFIFFLIFLII